jgi:hypothetical protein
MQNLAPLNARVHVEMLSPSYHFGRELGSVEVEPAMVSLWQRPARGPAAAIAVTRRLLVSARQRIVELVPEAPLQPHTLHDVVLDAGGRRETLGQFQTGASLDRAPPQWEGILLISYQENETPNSCETRKPYIKLARGEAQDPDSPLSTLAYALWAADAAGRIDYRRPPLLYEFSASRILYLGQPGQCSLDNFTLPLKARSLRLGVRLVDPAGNASTPSEITVDLTRPLLRVR